MLPVLLGYLTGSVPFAFLMARRAGIDVRFSGSGNVGAANVLRTTGAWRGALVMALDVGKGVAAVAIAYVMSGGAALAALTGAAAVVGHIYPVWLRFHGGKGVATACGVFWMLAPLATAISATLFVLTVWIWRYVSLGSIAATVALPTVAWFTDKSAPVVAGAAVAAVLIIVRHWSNLVRLHEGSERRLGQKA